MTHIVLTQGMVPTTICHSQILIGRILVAAGQGVKGMTVPSAVPNLRDVVHTHQAPCNYARLF